MAFNMTQLGKILKSGEPKQRFFLLLIIVVALIFIYIVFSKLFDHSTESGTRSSVGKAPGIESIQGGDVSPEYKRTLERGNISRAQQAQQTGGSAVSTIINTGQSGECLQCCPGCGESPCFDVQMNTLLSSGAITPKRSEQLNQLAKQLVVPDEMANQLQRLVRSNQLSTDQARKLYNCYQTEYANAQVAEGAKAMDDLIKSGKLPLDVADALLDLQKKNVSPEAYAAELQRLVREGKISPEVAQQLLAQYQKQHAKGLAAQSAAQVDSMMASGELSEAAGKKIKAMQEANLSPEDYQAALQRMVDAGELSPEAARKLMEQYRKQHGQVAGDADVSALTQESELPADAAADLKRLQDQDVPESDYANELQRLVSEGKISPEAAQKLLDQYRKMHAEKKAAKDQINDLVQSGKLPPEDAQKLLDLQDQNVPVSDYEDELNRLVKEGKISPETAQKLLDQYKKLHGAKEDTDAQLSDMVKNGEVPADVAADLQKLQDADIAPEDYAKKLEALVKEGKISPETAKKLLAQYNKLHGARADAKNGVEALATSGELPQEVADDLLAMQNKNSPVSDYEDQLNRLVKEGKISPETAQKLLAQYKALHGAVADNDQTMAALETARKLPTDAANALLAMQSKNASAGDYAKMLAQMVKDGKISPETAKRLLQAYQSRLAQQQTQVATAAVPIEQAGTATGLDGIQQRVTSAQAQQLALQQQTQLKAAEQQEALRQEQMHQQMVQQLSARMASQAQQIIGNNWAVSTQTMVQGQVPVDEAALGGAGAAAEDQAAGGKASGPPLIKAGTILYAVLDTAVNSDYANSPVMATIVSGKYKGAKLLGKLQTVQNGQRVMLVFDLMNMQQWERGKAVSAYAIDPDTAKSALATGVDNHYLLRYGSLFASSFMQGIGQAIESSGTDVSSSDGVVTSSTAELTTEEKILVALGQVGQSASSEVAKLVNTPPTVTIDSGMGVGVLFMSDVESDSVLTGSSPTESSGATSATSGVSSNG